MYSQALSDALDMDMPALPDDDEEEEKGGGLGVAVWDGGWVSGVYMCGCVFICLNICAGRTTIPPPQKTLTDLHTHTPKWIHSQGRWVRAGTWGPTTTRRRCVFFCFII